MRRSIRPCQGKGRSRREFLGTMGSIAAGFFVGGWAATPLDLAQPLSASRVALARPTGYDRALIRAALESTLSAIGGIADIVRPGDHVGIKINLTGGSSSAWSFQSQTGLHPGVTYWTHPEILRAVGEILLDTGAGKISILEALYDDESYYGWGYGEVGSELGAQLVDLNKTAPYSGYSVRPVGDGHFIYSTFTQNGILNDLDCVVSLAKSKQHNGAGVTHGIKNLVGTLPLPVGLYNNGQGYRAGIHAQYGLDGNPVSNLRRVVLDLHRATPINLVVNDAIDTVMGGEGPWGPPLTPVSFNSLVVSKDPVAADAIATQVMGMDPNVADGTAPFVDGINYLLEAEDIGMGTADVSRIEVIEAASTGTEHETPDRSNLGAVHCFPNPFVDATTIQFALRSSARVKVAIHDTGGRRIAKFSTRSYASGSNRVEWDGSTMWGHRAPAGAYIGIIEASGSRKTFKLARIE